MKKPECNNLSIPIFFFPHPKLAHTEVKERTVFILSTGLMSNSETWTLVEREKVKDTRNLPGSYIFLDQHRKTLSVYGTSDL